MTESIAYKVVCQKCGFGYLACFIDPRSALKLFICRWCREKEARGEAPR